VFDNSALTQFTRAMFLISKENIFFGVVIGLFFCFMFLTDKLEWPVEPACGDAVVGLVWRNVMCPVMATRQDHVRALQHMRITRYMYTKICTVYSVHCTGSEPVFVILLRSPGIDSKPGGLVLQPYLMYRPARLHSMIVHRLAESIPWNRFLKRLQIRALYTLC
jgi:hypothetical protein